jgi:hypothetical protein
MTEKQTYAQDLMSPVSRTEIHGSLATRSEWLANPNQPLGNRSQDVLLPAYTIPTYPIGKIATEALALLALDGGGAWADMSIELHKNAILKADGAEGIPILETEKNLPTRLLATSSWRTDLLNNDSSNLQESGLVAACNELGLRLKFIDKGIKEGYLPTNFKERVEVTRKTTRLRTVSSSLADAAKSIAFYGHYDPYRNEIVSYDALDATEGQAGISGRVNTLSHEYGHAESGGTFKIDPDTGDVKRTRTGFANAKDWASLPEFDEATPKKLAWNEASNHLLTLGLLTGDFATVDPDKRADGDKNYYGYRKVMAIAYEKAGGLLKVQTLTKALLEDTGKDGGFSARRALVSEFSNAYGFGSIQALETLMRHTDFVGTSEFKIKEIANCITPPTFTSSGAVERKGFIDLSLLPSPLTLEELVRLHNDDYKSDNFDYLPQYESDRV